MAEDMTVDPVGRQRYVFRRSSDERGELLEVEGWVDPGGDVPPHVHPHFEERFEVLEGELTFTLGRKKRRAQAGETAMVPPGTRHAFRNTGATTAHMRVLVRPPADLQAFLEDTAGLGRAGYITRVGPLALPKGVGGLLRGSVLLRHYRANTRILLPPPLVQRLLMDPLARLAERRGIRAGSFAQL